MKNFPLAISNSPLAIIAIAIIATLLFTSCRKDEYETPYMTMTMTMEGRLSVMFYLGGSGEATIDWGDGTPPEIHTLSNTSKMYSYIYSNSNSPHYVVTISGNNITALDCGFIYETTHLDVSKNMALTNLDCRSNQLTSLDLSKNTALRTLICYNNQLTSLDLSKNMALQYLSCTDNQLTSLNLSKNSTALAHIVLYNNNLQTSALNALFHSLPTVTDGRITIGNNPGTNTCDGSIAMAKGWSVRDY